MNRPYAYAWSWTSRLLSGLPSGRALGIAAALLVGVSAVATAGWFWVAAEQRKGSAAIAEGLVRAQASQDPQATADTKTEAIRSLEELIRRHPSAPLTSRAAYEVGNLKYQLQRYAEARTAYEVAAAGARSETVQRLARAAIGHAWEAERNYQKAQETYDAALAPLRPGDFLYEDLLIDLARVQERTGRTQDAIKTYRRVLENPKSPRSDDVRTQLARLGAL